MTDSRNDHYGNAFDCIQLRAQYAAQLNGIQADFEGLSLRLEEETETSQNIRGQLARAQNDYQLLKNKYDKEIVVLTEELDDSRSVIDLS